MEIDLTTKLPLREHIRNIKKLTKKIYNMDKTYFYTVCIVHIINVVVPYISLILSAYIIDALTDKKTFKEIFAVAAAAVLGIFILHLIGSTVWNRLEVRRENMYLLYSCITEEKMLNMDFSRIDSPEVEELKERIRRDNNWGAGLNSFFWQFNGILFGCFNLIGAVIVGAPIVIYMFRSGKYQIAVILIILATVMAGATKCMAYFRKKEDVYMFKAYTEEEKKKKSNCCWSFACGDGYNYKNGKDIRIYEGYDLIKSWTTDRLSVEEYRKELREVGRNAAGKGFFGNVSMGAAEGCSYLIAAIIAVAGTISIGEIIKFAGCLKNLFVEILGIGNNISSFAMTCRKQISTLELLGIEDEMYKGKIPVEKRSDNEYQIEFKDVSFKYPGTDQYALSHFSLKLKIGERLAIVGMNGSGKTTMIKLLCRLYDPDEGEILLNGVDIKKFRQDEYSRLFSVVFQDYVLFSFLLGQNVAVDVEYDGDKVRKCLKDAGMGEKFDHMKNGIDTYLYKDYDDSGVEISGGEAQKIALARAVYKEAPFILLDEPTAALDPLSEYEVYSNFDKIAGNKTAVYISHRLSSCRFCEKIAVFHQGSLIQLGSHDELVADKGGKYYEMWNSQAQYYRENGMESLI